MRAKLLDKGKEALSEPEMLLYAGKRLGATKPLDKALKRLIGSLSAMRRAPATLLG